MLVLTRKESQRIYIGNDIVVTVAEIRGNKVRLAIEAPRHMSVDREEVAHMKSCEAFLESLKQESMVSSFSNEVYGNTENPTSVLSAGSPL